MQERVARREMWRVVTVEGVEKPRDLVIRALGSSSSFLGTMLVSIRAAVASRVHALTMLHLSILFLFALDV